MLLLSLAVVDVYGFPANVVITPLNPVEPNVGMAELACSGFAVGFQCAEMGIHDLTHSVRVSTCRIVTNCKTVGRSNLYFLVWVLSGYWLENQIAHLKCSRDSER